MSGLAEEKVRAREQWTQDPCGAVSDREHEFGTREFFDTVEGHRYIEYAPWMPQLMGFDKFRDARLLEIGCGMGTDLLQFARGGACCTGIDLTPRSIEITRHRFRLYDAGGAFMISDGEHLPFRDEASTWSTRTEFCTTHPTQRARYARSIACCARVEQRR